MDPEKEIIETCRVATVYEAMKSMLKALLTIDQMRTVLKSLQMYVDAEEEHMRRNNG